MSEPIGWSDDNGYLDEEFEVGRVEGYREGEEAGWEAGYRSGYDDGFATGMRWSLARPIRWLRIRLHLWRHPEDRPD